MAKRNDSVVMVAAEDSAIKKGHNIFPKIFSVVLAFVLWFYVMTVESPTNRESFSGIPVEVQLSSNSDFTVYSGDGMTIEVTVSGKRSDLNQLSSEDFKAVVDARRYTTPGKYSIPVEINAPRGATVVEHPGELLVHLDIKELKEVPVQVKVLPDRLDEGLEIAAQNEMIINPSKVSVRGPKTVLDTIETAEITADVGIVTASFSIIEDIKLYDKEGNEVVDSNVFVDQGTVTVDVPVFATKEIDLKVDFLNGLLDSSNCDVILTPSSIKVRGTVGALNSLDEYVISTIDEKRLVNDKMSTSLTLPDGITAVGGEKTVEVQIRHKGTDKKTVTVKGINVNNPKGLSYDLEKDSVTLTIRGDEQAIKEITAEDITLTVDLSSQNAGVGNINLPVDVKFSGEYAKTVYEIGEKDQYSVSVTIK